MKKYFGILSICFMILLAGHRAEAAALASGTLKNGITWEVSDAYVLTLTGQGDTGEERPWENYGSQVVEIVVNPGITGLGEAAFYQFSRAAKVTLPSTLKEIGTAAFADCYGLKELALNEGLVRIGDYAFQNTQIPELTLPASVKEVSELAFAAAGTSLQYIGVADGNSVYTSVDGVLFSKDMKTLVKYPPARKAERYQIPGSVTEVTDYAFGFAKVSEITIPFGVQKLGAGSFSASDIMSLIIPDSVTEIGDFLCDKCGYLTKVKIGEGLKKLSYRTFLDCYSLTSVEFGSALEDLDYQSFAQCTSLTSVTIPEKVTVIKNGAFFGCTSLTDVKLPAGLQEIWHQGFCNCTSLTSIEFPDGLRSINRSSFIGTACKDVKIPGSVKKIGDGAFSEDANLVFERPIERQEDGSYLDTVKIPVKVRYDYTAAFEVLKLVNKERAKQGLSALVMDEKLLETAMKRGAELGVFYSHTRPTGVECFTANSRMTAENIGAGYTTSASAMSGWMNSEGHRANILGEDHTCIGVGAVQIDGTNYWVQCFGDDTPAAVQAEAYADATQLASVSTFQDEFEEDDEKFEIVTSPKAVKIEEGASQKLKLGFNNTFTNLWVETQYLQFSSTDEAVCTVDTSGKVTGTREGKAEIHVLLQGSDTVMAKVPVTVEKKKAKLYETYEADGLKYTVTNIRETNRTVTAAGVSNKNIVTLKIPDAVVIADMKFKVTRIGERAFANMRNLKEVTIGKNISVVEAKAFYGCAKLKKIVFAGSSVKTIGSNALKGIAAKAVLYAPSKKVTAYKKLLTSKTGFTSKMKLKSTVSKTWTVTFKNGAKTVKTQKVADGAAAVAPKLTKKGYLLSWSASFAKITKNLTVKAVWTPELPKKGYTATVGTLKYKVTKSSKTKGTVQVTGVSIKTAVSYTIPEKVKIGKYRFTVTGIAANAFKGCKKVTKIVLPKTITSVGKNAFLVSASRTTVTIPKAQYNKITALIKKSGISKKITMKRR